jgi:hypothetical protein
LSGNGSAPKTENPEIGLIFTSGGVRATKVIPPSVDF